MDKKPAGLEPPPERKYHRFYALSRLQADLEGHSCSNIPQPTHIAQRKNQQVHIALWMRLASRNAAKKHYLGNLFPGLAQEFINE